MQEDRHMFSLMLAAARNRLAQRSPEEIARKCGMAYDAQAGCFRFKSLAQSIEVSHPNLEFSPELEGWHQLVILHCMDLADGAPCEGRLISFSQLRDGMVRGGGFDRSCEARIEALMNRISAEEFQSRCLALDGKILPSNADFAVEFPFLPNLPVTLKLWFADEDFGASGRMLLDGSAGHYLTVEDAVTVGEILLEKLSAFQ